jgi:hypothetical protein
MTKKFTLELTEREFLAVWWMVGEGASEYSAEPFKDIGDWLYDLGLQEEQIENLNEYTVIKIVDQKFKTAWAGRAGLKEEA